MPITVHAHIAQDAVFYAGEKFSCTVTIKNEVGPQNDISTSVSATPSDSSFAIPLLNQFSELNLGSTNASSTDLLSNSAPTSPQKSQGYFISTPATNSTNSLQNSSTTLPQYETFLWGYIQLIGNFNVDNGLLNQNILNGFLGKLKTMAAATTGGVNVKPGNTGRDDSYPTFTTPSSLLFVDLKLAPGESKTYIYETMLPLTLPPTHRGRVIRFSYKLIVSIQPRTIQHSPLLVNVPFRVFNIIEDDGQPLAYDISNPTIVLKDEARVECEDDVQIEKKLKMKGTSQAELLSYLKSLDTSDETNPFDSSVLLESFKASVSDKENFTVSSPIVDVKENGKSNGKPSNARDDFIRRYVNGRWSRKILCYCQNRGCAVFDICKGSDRIAQLRLLKSVCRLGEVITGVIDFSKAIIQSYQLSISLESSETVHPDFISPYKSSASISNLSKRVVAEYHSFVGNTQKMPISLSIPVNATPEFATNAVSLNWTLRLSFITSTTSTQSPSTSTTSLDDPNDPDSSPNSSSYSLPPQYPPQHKLVSSSPYFAEFIPQQYLNVEHFECNIPIKVLGTGEETGRLWSGNVKKEFIVA